MFNTSTIYPRIELLHSTCCSVYWLIIVDYLKITHFWAIFGGLCLIHYIVTASEKMIFAQALFFISTAMFVAKSIQAKKYTYSQTDSGQASMTINGLRYIVCSLVSISIFMCDFPFYPMHKMKSTYFGISLMDFGVVAFMLNAGMISSVSHRFRLKKSLYMLAMGIIRLGVILSGYHIDPTEYGTHLNFYFIYLLAENATLFLKHLDPFISGISILIAHEAMISQPSMADFVFFSNRDTFIKANREGLISIIPYAGVLLLGKTAGNIIFKKNQTYIKTFCRLVMLWATLIVIHYVFLHNIQPSRRLCSLSFISFSCSAIIFPMCILYGVLCIYQIDNIEFLSQLSRLMGPLFLLANLYVLIGNSFFNWKKLSWELSHLVNVLYIFLLFITPVFIYQRYAWIASERASKNKKVYALAA